MVKKSNSKQAVSAGHELTLEVAKEILLAGGNAFDAAIAAHLAMFITEPCMASAGGAGFAMIVHNAKVQMFDFFSQTPKSKTQSDLDYYPVTIDFGEEKEIFNIGIASAAVPGTIAGIFQIHQQLASMPFKDLIQPAQKLAKEGVALNTFQAFDLQLLKPIFEQDKSVEEIFFNDQGIKKEGDLIKMPNLVNFLDFLVDEELRGFYNGEIAASISRDVKIKGGNLTREDFEDYRVNIKKPFSITKNKYNIHLPNGPSLGAGLFASALGYFDKNYSIEESIIKSQVENKHLHFLPHHLSVFYPNHNFSLDGSGFASKGTSHFSILDKENNAISLTTTIGEGCGYFIPHTDMHLNNMLGETFLLPNGEHSWKENTRLNSMMTPVIVTDPITHEPIFVSGSGGASRIPYAILQVLINLFERKQSLAKATTNPRYHYQSDCLHIEKGAEIPNVNTNKKIWENKSLFFGGVHSIFKSNHNLEAIGDARRYGVAEVF